MAIIHVDGKEFQVDGADNLLHACLSLGLDIPYFCWHPALGSVGACRQCAVKAYRDANDKQGRIVMSCMTPSSDGTYISISDPEAVAFRESVVEWLMTNHPHDCPVCEEGGHCHLQDMTVMTGHSARRYRFTKRTHENQDLGPFVAHEMNRCIACYRCVRYYKDYAGGKDLGVYASRSNVYFGRAEDGVLESEFSGNLTEVCPTGVFTDRTHSDRYSRKWDMQFAPSVCQQCSVGCNTSPGERYGEIRRIENRFNGTVNHYFLCDRGRFGYGYVNRKDRPRQALIRRQGELAPVEGKTALANVGDALRHCKRIIGIGSPRASLESNFALRELVGADNYSVGVSAAELAVIQRALAVLKAGPARTPSLREIEHADAAFLLGEDVTMTAPRIALALRQVANGKATELAAKRGVAHWQAEAIANIGQHEKNPIFVSALAPTKLDEIAAGTYFAAPAELARFGFAVAAAIDASLPVVVGLPAPLLAQAARVAEALLAAQRPLIVSGTTLLSVPLIEAAAAVTAALHAKGKTTAEISYVLPEVNSMGVAMMGGHSLEGALAALQSGAADGVVILENDLYRRVATARVDAALQAAGTVVVIDHQRSATSDRASHVLPGASFAEGDGTVVSNEGRAQRFFQVFAPSYYDPACDIRENWDWLHALEIETKRTPRWEHLDSVTAACASALPQLAGIVDAAPNASFRIKGMKIAREPQRYSGRTAMRAKLSVHEPRAPQDVDTALAFSMEGHNGTQAGDRPGALIPFAWSPGWNSPQAWNKFQDEVGGHLRAGDPGVRLIEPTGTAAVAGTIPPASSVTAGQWTVQPVFHFYGSEELSARAAPVATQIPAAALVLGSADAAALGLGAGATVELKAEGLSLKLPVRIEAAFAAGTVGVPLLPNIPYIAPGSVAQIAVVAS